GAGGGNAFGLAGAFSENSVTTTTQALISSGSNVSSGNLGDVTLTATNTATITADGGGATIAASVGASSHAAVAIGFGEATNNLGTSSQPNIVQTGIDNSTVTSAGKVVLSASATPTINTVGYGVAIAATSGQLAAGGSGAGATDNIDYAILSYIRNNSTVSASS